MRKHFSRDQRKMRESAINISWEMTLEVKYILSAKAGAHLKCSRTRHLEYLCVDMRLFGWAQDKFHNIPQDKKRLLGGIM